MQHFNLSSPINQPNPRSNQAKKDIVITLKACLLQSIKNVNHNFNDNCYYGFIGTIILMVQITIFLWNLTIWHYDIKNTNDMMNIVQNFQYFIKLFRFIYSIDESIIPFYYAYSLSFLYIIILCVFFFLTIYTEKKFPSKLFAFFGYFHRFFCFFACQYIFMKAIFCNFNDDQYIELFSTIHIVLIIIGIIGAIINLTLTIITNAYYFKGFIYDSLASFNHKKCSYFIHTLGIIAIICNIPQNYIIYIKITISTLILSLSVIRLYIFSRYIIYLNRNMNKLKIFECVHYITVSILIYCSLIIDNNNIESASSILFLIIGTIIIATKSIYLWIEYHKNTLLTRRVEVLANDLEAIQHFYAFQSLTVYGMGDIEEPGPKDIRRLMINGIMIAHYKSCKDIKCICRYTDYIQRKNKPEDDSYEKVPIHFSSDSKSIEDFSKFLLECYLKKFPDSNDLKLLAIQYYINSSRLSHRGFMMLEKLENHNNIEFYIELSLELLKDQYHNKMLNDIENVNNDGLYIKNMIIYAELQVEFVLLLENQLINMQAFWNELLNNEVLIKKIYMIGQEIFKNEETIEKYWDQISILVNKRLELPYLIYGLYKSIACNSSSIADDLINTYANILEHVMSIKNDKINHGFHTLYSKNSMYFICSSETKTMGNILLCSENVINLIGYNKEELLGKSVDILIPKIYRKFHGEALLEFSNSDRFELSSNRKFLFYTTKNGIINPCNIYIKLDHHIKYGMIFLGVIKSIKTSSQYILIDANGNIDSATYEITNELSLNRIKYENNLSKLLNIDQFCTKFEQINRVCNTVIQANNILSKQSIYGNINIENDKNKDAFSLYNQLSIYEYEKMNEYYKILNEGIKLKFHSRLNNRRSAVYNDLKRLLNHSSSIKTMLYIAKITDRIYKNNNVVRIIELNKPNYNYKPPMSFAKFSKNKDKSILDCIEEEYLDEITISNPRERNYSNNDSYPNDNKNSQNLKIFDLSPLNTKYDNIKFTYTTQIQTEIQTSTSLNLHSNDCYKFNTETIPKVEISSFDNEKTIELNNSVCENIDDEGIIDQINHFYKINIKDYSYSKDSELVHFNSTSPNLSNISFVFNNSHIENVIPDKDHHKHMLIKNNHDYEPYKKLAFNDDDQNFIENPENMAENKSEKIFNGNNAETSTTTIKRNESNPTVKQVSYVRKQSRKPSLIKTKEIENKTLNKKFSAKTMNLCMSPRQKRKISKQIIEVDTQIDQSMGTSSVSIKKHVQQTVEKAVISSYCSKYVKYMKILCFLPIFLNLGVSIASCIIQNTYINSIEGSMKAIQNTYKQLDYIVEMNRRTRMLLLLKQGLIDNDRHSLGEIKNYSRYCITKIDEVNQNLKDVTNLMANFMYTSMAPEYRDQIVNEKIKITWNSSVYLDNEEQLLFFDALETLITEAYYANNFLVDGEMDDKTYASFVFILKNTLNGYLIGLTESSQIFQIAINDRLFDIKKNTHVNVGIGIFLVMLFIILFSASISKLIKEKIVVFKLIATINNSKIRLIIERLNLLRTFIKSPNKTHRLMDQVLQTKNNIEYKLSTIDNLNNKKAKNNILNTKDFYEKCWIIASKIILIGTFISWYYIFIMVIFTIYEQNCRLLISKINNTYSILTKQGLQMSMTYEFLSDDNGLIENQPILDVINVSLLRGGLYTELLKTFEDQNFQIDLITNIIDQSLCNLKTTNGINKQCLKFCNGVCTKDLLSLTAYIERILSDLISRYLTSNQSFEISRELLQSQALIELEALYYNYSRTAFDNILNILNNVFDDLTNRLLIIQLILLMIYVLSVWMMALMLINPLMKKLKDENMSLKKFLRLIPTNLIINNKYLTKYLIDTSPNFFNLNKLI